MRQLEHHGLCCHVIAFVNARIYFGDPRPPVQGLPWQTLLGITGCRCKLPTWAQLEEAAAYLQIKLQAVPCTLKSIAGNLPAMIFVKTRHDVDHAVLVIDVRGTDIVMVNYKGQYEDDAVQIRSWDKLHFPENNVAYAISY